MTNIEPPGRQQYTAQPRSASGRPGYVNPPYIQAPGGPQPEFPPRVQKRRARKAVLTALAVFAGAMLLLCGIGIAVAANSGPPAAHNPLIDTVTATPPSATKASEPNGQAAAAVPSAAAPSKAATATTAAPAGFSDEGTLMVPGEVPPGTYRATVPADSLNCYWARLKGSSNEFENIIANGNAAPGAKVTVTVKATDKAFHSTGCGRWAKVG